jgi:hypothetical protein
VLTYVPVLDGDYLLAWLRRVGVVGVVAIKRPYPYPYPYPYP